MNAAGIDTSLDFTGTRGGPDDIALRLEALPASSHLWRLVILLSLGGSFEIYDLFLTGYIAPGLNRSGLLTTTTQAFSCFHLARSPAARNPRVRRWSGKISCPLLTLCNKSCTVVSNASRNRHDVLL